MRSIAMILGLSSAAIALTALSGCSWREWLPPDTPTLPNHIAVDSALRLCSLTQGDQPFHLILDVTPPDHFTPEMHAQIEIHWLNPITYRAVIHSSKFSQIRVVNGPVVEEHDSGDYYPRWIQNFVDAVLDPVPKAPILRKIPGSVPIGVQSHACVSNQPSYDADVDQSSSAQICFQDADPKIASGGDFTRLVWFSDFAPFGSQQIARTLINDLPANSLVRGQIELLEPLSRAAYPLLKAREFTLPVRQIRTALVPASTARSLLESMPPQPLPVSASSRLDPAAGGSTVLYIRTDRTGKVREAYRDRSDVYGLQKAAVTRALTLKFKPLVVHGTPQQMEAPFAFPF